MQKTMTSKSIYFLMEIMIVLIFFALSAAICLQLLVSAHDKSMHGMQLRFAMQEGSNLIETIQATHQIPDSYDVEDEEITYRIQIDKQVDANITKGTVKISSNEKALLELPFALKEVQP